MHYKAYTPSLLPIMQGLTAIHSSLSTNKWRIHCSSVTSGNLRIAKPFNYSIILFLCISHITSNYKFFFSLGIDFLSSQYLHILHHSLYCYQKLDSVSKFQTLLIQQPHKLYLIRSEIILPSVPIHHLLFSSHPYSPHLQEH